MIRTSETNNYLQYYLDSLSQEMLILELEFIRDIFEENE